MNTARIFQNSWNMMLRYRALWIFGVVLALTSISLGSALWMRNRDESPDRTLVNWELSDRDQAWIKANFGLDLPLRYTLSTEDLQFRLDDPSLSAQARVRLLNIAITVIAVLLGLWVLAAALRYTSEAALIRMVNDRQYSQVSYTARQGWSLGFSLSALKFFLIDLLIYPPLVVLSLLLVTLAGLPALIAILGSPAAVTLGLLLAFSLLLVSLAAIIVLWIAGLVVGRLARRAACLDGLGVFASLWRAVGLMRAGFRGVSLTWLIVVGLDLVYPLLAAPVLILLAAAGLVVGGLAFLGLGSLLALVLAKTAAWTIAVIVGAALLALLVGVPMALLGGLREVFRSSAWTLTYTEAAGAQDVAPAPAPQPALPQAAAA